MKTKLLFVIVLLITVATKVSAQHWRLGGNNTVPAVDNVTLPGNNFIGTSLGIVVPLRIGLSASCLRRFLFLPKHPSPFQL